MRRAAHFPRIGRYDSTFCTDVVDCALNGHSELFGPGDGYAGDVCECCGSPVVPATNNLTWHPIRSLSDRRRVTYRVLVPEGIDYRDGYASVAQRDGKWRAVGYQPRDAHGFRPANTDLGRWATQGEAESAALEHALARIAAAEVTS